MKLDQQPSSPLEITQRNKTLKLAFFDNESSWDLYVDKDGALSSIAKPNCGAKDSGFGDRNHISRLISRYGNFEYAPTNVGLRLMEGFHCDLTFILNKKSTSPWLKFNVKTTIEEIF